MTSSFENWISVLNNMLPGVIINVYIIIAFVVFRLGITFKNRQLWPICKKKLRLFAFVQQIFHLRIKHAYITAGTLLNSYRYIFKKSIPGSLNLLCLHCQGVPWKDEERLSLRKECATRYNIIYMNASIAGVCFDTWYIYSRGQGCKIPLCKHWPHPLFETGLFDVFKHIFTFRLRSVF